MKIKISDDFINSFIEGCKSGNICSCRVIIDVKEKFGLNELDAINLASNFLLPLLNDKRIFAGSYKDSKYNVWDATGKSVVSRFKNELLNLLQKGEKINLGVINTYFMS